MSDDEQPNSGALVGDLTGIGKVVNSEVVQQIYSDALSPSMRQLGQISEETLKTCRLFTAPIQFLAAYQDRFGAFCDRVRKKVPEARQREAPPEIVKPVMEAFAFTSDDSPLMVMFEELMARAIDSRESDKLSPEFPAIIQSLSPLQAKLIQALMNQDQCVDTVLQNEQQLITHRFEANFSPDDYGGVNHHLALIQDLKEKKLTTTFNSAIDKETSYPNFTIPAGSRLIKMTWGLSMFGRWFAESCTKPETQTSTA